MKTYIFTRTLAAMATFGIAFSATASTDGKAAAGTHSVSDEPEVKILFHHTAGNPYDIRLLTYCGGFASRLQVVPKTNKTLVIAYNTGDLHGAKITGHAPSRIGFCVCKGGKTTTLIDLLSVEKRETLLPDLATRLSSATELKYTLAQEARGLLNVKTFARTSMSPDLYAYAAAPIATP